MNEDIQNLGKFIQIYNNLKQNEDLYGYFCPSPRKGKN